MFFNQKKALRYGGTYIQLLKEKQIVVFYSLCILALIFKKETYINNLIFYYKRLSSPVK